MPYGVDTQAFHRLHEQVLALPEELPADPRPLEGLLFAYKDAFAVLLQIVMAIMQICVERQESRQYVRHFLPIFDQALERILVLLDTEIREGLEQQSINLVELAHAIRESQMAGELLALDQAFAESEGAVEPEDHLDTATTVTNSFKEQIEKHTKRKWIKSVLHALNEVISIVRGVV